MNQLLLTLALALLWAMTTGTFTLPNLLLGGLVALVALFVLRAFLAPPKSTRRLRRMASLFWLFLYELVASAVRVALVVIDPRLRRRLRPAIVAVPLSVRTDAEITLLANLITLTPGTLSIDLSPDRSKLYVHVLTLDSAEALIADIKNGFEAKVMEVFADERE